MWVLSSLGLFVFFSLPASCLPSLNTCMSNTSQPLSLSLSLSIRHPPPCDADLWKPAWNVLYPVIIFFSSPPALLLFTSVQAGGAPLNRLVVSRGIASRRRGLPGTASRQTVSWESPVSPTFSRDPVLFCQIRPCTWLMTSPVPTHTLLGMIWHGFFFSHGIHIHFLFECVCVCVCV